MVEDTEKVQKREEMGSSQKSQDAPKGRDNEDRAAATSRPLSDDKSTNPRQGADLIARLISS